MAQKSIHYAGADFAISYEIINPSAPRDCLILHGWGASKELMRNALGACLPQWRHIYVDLPGFGNSNCDIVLQTKDYASIMERFCGAAGVKKELIIGHSFGGKVATLLAPEALVLMATSGIVVEKPLKVKAKIALYKLLKNLGFASLRRYFASDDGKSLSDVMYETFKNVVDENFSESFGACRSRTLLLWGRDDTATPLASAEKIHALISGSQLVATEGDHYFFLHDKSFTCKQLETFMEHAS